MDTEHIKIPEGRAAARGTLVTLLFRIVSFGCTQATLRWLDPTTLGKASIQLELLLTTVLFISREGFRLALTRNVSKENWNIAWLTIPTVSLVALSSALWHLFYSPLSNEDQDYRIGGLLYCLAAWIEGCGEPAVLHFLRQMNVAKRASAEGIATVAKTVTTIICLRSVDENWHVTAFGTAQLVYGIVYSVYLYSSSWPVMVKPQLTALEWGTCNMTFVFTIQGVFKHLLTEADKIILTAVSSNYNQGVYAMGSSYGGMAARILLQPLEENARLLWSRLAGRKDTNELETSYKVLVKLVIYVGLLFSCIAVNYTNLLLNILAGRKWGSNPEAAQVLSAFCVYTAFLACNGMTEAFVYGVASSGGEMGRLGLVHMLTGVCFAAAAFFLVPSHGTVGLVLANCIAMVARSSYSVFFAFSYFVKHSTSPPNSFRKNLLQALLPQPIVVFGFGLAWVSTRWSLKQLEERSLHFSLDYNSKEWLFYTGQHLGMGITCVIGLATLATSLESTFIQSLRSMVRPKRDE